MNFLLRTEMTRSQRVAIPMVCVAMLLTIGLLECGSADDATAVATATTSQPSYGGATECPYERSTALAFADDG